MHALHEWQPTYDRLLYASSWKKWLAETMTDYDILLPDMPNKQNAKYHEWALTFTKILPLLHKDAVLIGHSLGGIFLARYFSDHTPSQKLSKIILIAPPYNDETGESLADFKLVTAHALAKASDEIHILHSEDDPIVPMHEAHRYMHDLPQATLHAFTDKGHFNDTKLPELLDILQH